MNIKKIVTLIGYVANELGAIDKLKLVKLLYFIDKVHLIEYGRFVTNDTYVKMPYGPVPTKILDIINDPEKNLFNEDKKYFFEFLAINDDKSRTIKCKKAPDTTEMSKSEIKIADSVLHRYGKQKSGKMIDISHKEIAWKKASSNDNLSILDMIGDLPKQRKSELIDILEENTETNKMLHTLQA